MINSLTNKKSVSLKEAEEIIRNFTEKSKADSPSNFPKKKDKKSKIKKKK